MRMLLHFPQWVNNVPVQKEAKSVGDLVTTLFDWLKSNINHFLFVSLDDWKVCAWSKLKQMMWLHCQWKICWLRISPFVTLVLKRGSMTSLHRCNCLTYFSCKMGTMWYTLNTPPLKHIFMTGTLRSSADSEHFFPPKIVECAWYQLFISHSCKICTYMWKDQ